MRKLHNISDFDLSYKKDQAKAWVRVKAHNVGNWIYDNKDMIMVFGPVTIGAVTTGIKVIGKNVNLRKEKNMKNLYCYDRSLGHYWALRRELTNSEWVQIDKRKNNGERLADILDELKVLK